MPDITRHCYTFQELPGEDSVLYLNLTDYHGKDSSSYLKFLNLEAWEAESNGDLPLLALGLVHGTSHIE